MELLRDYAIYSVGFVHSVIDVTTPLVKWFIGMGILTKLVLDVIAAVKKMRNGKD